MRISQFNNRAAFPLITAGQHPAICTGVVDLGTQTSVFDGKPSIGRKLMKYFNVLDQVNPKTGRPLSLAEMRSATMHPKGRLRREMESWIGPFPDQGAANDFDLKELVGRQCQLIIKHTDNPVAPRAVIEAILPPLSNVITSLAMNDDNMYFSLDKPDMYVFEQLPGRVQRMIEASPEWQTIVSAA
ncbi:phage replication initiation protein, NGO0469 family [Paraburkholderia sp. RL17-337-BIB-A]|uniref:phage replication initiation protein, NGO0469 family n=1 Tax=Paraburkholderia sp. RL17-337-BIB-A TaxID=3031636 RepID=UPI0038B843D0